MGDNYRRSNSRSVPRDMGSSEAASSSSSANTPRNYTDEDAFMCTHIIENKRNFYDVLQIQQHPFDPQEATKSYRRFARAVHPDKNKAPDATEAFKILGQAYETLSDDTKRRQYEALVDSGELLTQDDAAVDDIYFRLFGYGVVKICDWMGLLDANVDRRVAVIGAADLGRQLWNLYKGGQDGRSIPDREQQASSSSFPSSSSYSYSSSSQFRRGRNYDRRNPYR